MSTVDEQFDRFKAAWRAGEAPDPRAYLARLEAPDRAELEALIDGYLARAAAPPPAAAEPDPLTRRVMASVLERTQAPETWRTLLPHARQSAELPRSDLVDRLARDLGVAAQRDKVAAYYHQMEQGTLPPAGVSDRVLAALARILGIPAERLRAAGRRLAPPAAGPAAFARARRPARAAADPTPAAPRAQPPEPPRDAVDDLFRGG
ncbi:MAG TPA: hypothetical protein VH418_10085 [Solirubrobacteraceae bacterium]|jgi:hypothetical protein